jgi:transcriptional regulator with GAF, ATPase, and Fis domain
MAKADAAQTDVFVVDDPKCHDESYEHTDLRSPIDQVMIYKCELMQKVLKSAIKYALSNAHIQIYGGNGSGKEIIANIIHKHSRRCDKPIVKINCSALPTALIESELFGHVKGAFTGAINDKKGKFEIADGGTILLDEIGDLPLQNQPKLLRVIESKELTPIGSTTPVKIDVRVLSSTNRDLKKMVNEGSFREDLYHRLSVLNIFIPPLRERKEDIPLLASYFMKLIAVEESGPTKELSSEAVACLVNREYSGNVRELKNLIYRMYLCSESEIITSEDAESAGAINEVVDDEFPKGSMTYNQFKDLMEGKYLEKQLVKNDYNLTKTARSIKMHKGNLSRKLKDLGIDIKTLRTDIE